MESEIYQNWLGLGKAHGEFEKGKIQSAKEAKELLNSDEHAKLIEE